MMAALKVAFFTSRSTGASVSPLLVARTAPEGKEKQRLALRKQVSFKTLSKLNSEDGVRELAKVWSGSNGDGEDAEEEPDPGPSPLPQTRSLLLKKTVSFRLTTLGPSGSPNACARSRARWWSFPPTDAGRWSPASAVS